MARLSADPYGDQSLPVRKVFNDHTVVPLPTVKLGKPTAKGEGYTIEATNATPDLTIYYWIGVAHASNPEKYSARSPPVAKCGRVATVTMFSKNLQGRESDHIVKSFTAEETNKRMPRPTISKEPACWPEVEMTCEMEGATIFYTTDGTEPKEVKHRESIIFDDDGLINSTHTYLYTPDSRPCVNLQDIEVLSINAICTHPNVLASPVYSIDLVAEQVSRPTITVDSDLRTLAFKCSTNDATLFYTLDGSSPTPGDANTRMYSSSMGQITPPFDGSAPKVKCKAFVYGMVPSTIALAALPVLAQRAPASKTQVQEQVTRPKIKRLAGKRHDSVIISCDTCDSRIEYAIVHTDSDAFRYASADTVDYNTYVTTPCRQSLAVYMCERVSQHLK